MDAENENEWIYPKYTKCGSKTRVFNFYICECHEKIIGLEEGNDKYQEHCGGRRSTTQHCGWESDAGYAILNANNKVKSWWLAPWVETNIERDHYSFCREAVFMNLYDIDNNHVEVREFF